MSVSDNHEQPTNLVWQLVIHRPISELLWLEQYLKDKCDRYLGGEHTPDSGCNRIHCHYSLINYKHTKQALQKFLNSKGIIGSDNFGLLTVWNEGPNNKKPYDEHKLNQYITKGDDKVELKFHGYTDDIIRNYRTNYNTDQENFRNQLQSKTVTKIQYKLKIENPKEAKIRKNDFLKELHKRIVEKYPDVIQRDEDNILEEIRLLHCEYHEVIGEYKSLDLYDTYIMRNHPRRWIDSMKGLLEKRKPR